jgi:4-amino-4-deoxy-L-arabinose transferase-like glycosyltransferase
VTKLSPTLFLVCLVVLSAFAVYFELGRGDITTADEGQRAAPPAEMLRSGDYLLPKLNGRAYLSKPPLLYWVIAGVYTATGTISEWTARLTTATTGLLMALSLYLLFRRRAGETVARWAALMMIAAPYFLERARWTNLEVPTWYFTFLTVAILWFAWQSTESRTRWGLAVAGGLTLGAATLLKGPVPYLFLVAGFLAFLLLEGRDPETAIRKAVRWSLGCLLVGLVLHFLPVPFPAALILLLGGWFLLAFRYGGPAWGRSLPVLGLALVMGVGLAVPWAVAVLLDQGWENIQKLLAFEVAERTYKPTEINSGDPTFFYRQLPFIVAPWGLLFPLHFARKTWQQGDALYRFCVTMGWLSLAIFSLIAGKEREYVMPCVPFLMLASAYFIARGPAEAQDAWAGTWLTWWRKASLVIVPVAAIGLMVHAVLADFRTPLMLVEVAALCGTAIVVLLLPGRADWNASIARLTVAVVLVSVCGLMLRSYERSGENTMKPLALLCRDLKAAGVTVEATKIYPNFFYYAEYVIPETIQKENIRPRLTGPEPYFYLTIAGILNEFYDPATMPALYISRPYGDKKLMLVGNVDPSTLVPPATGLRATLSRK